MKPQNEKILIFTFKGTKQPYKLGETEAWLNEQGLRWKALDGYYNKEFEPSYLVVDNNPAVEPLVREFCRKHNQESYLVSNPDRSTRLVFLSGAETALGTLKVVPKKSALYQEAYSYDRDTGEYWATM